MKKPLLYSLMSALPLLGTAQALQESFEDITTLDAAGWIMTNQSNPVGSTGWIQGSTTVFPAHSGPATAFIGANFNNTSGAGDISNWLITPEVNVQDGDILSFWTRVPTGTEWNDHLEVRSSTGTLQQPVGSADVGSFTNLLISINENYDLSYPETWTRYAWTVADVGSTPVAMRFAFRYNVINGGPGGDDSNYIGIDDVYVGPADDEPGEEPCVPSLDCTDGDVILNVTFLDINNSSDCGDGGYSDYTDMSAVITPGSSHPISVTVGDGWTEHVGVWIDFNNDGLFSADEYMGEVGEGGQGVTLDGTLDIPADLGVGSYTMRLLLVAGPVSAEDACMSANYGEGEDYTLVVGNVGIAGQHNASFSFHPNPVKDFLSITTEKSIKELEGYNMVGQQVFGSGNLTAGQVDLSALPTGVYVFKATFTDGSLKTFKLTKD